jgi:hypothetical protein
MHRISIRGISTVTAVVVATATLGITTDAFGSPDRPIVDSTPVSALAIQHAALLKSEAAVVRADRAHAVRVAALKVAHKKLAAKHSAAKKRAAAREAAAREAAALRASRAARSVRPGSNRALGRDLAAARGWGDVQFVCLDNLWSNESGWSQSAANTSSGAYGIPQAKPGSKMASAGSDWATNPRTQIAWGLSYIGGRYGSPCGAWSTYQSKGWY